MWSTASSEARRPRALRAICSAALAGLPITALLAGCATGPAFVAPEPPQPYRAAVYVYRTQDVLGAGVRHEDWFQAKPVGKMVNGGYMRFDAIPGVIWVSAPDCRPASIDVVLRPETIGYVQLELVNKTVEFGGKYYFDYGCRLVQRSEAEAVTALPGLRKVTD